jgi:hypothetical protein
MISGKSHQKKNASFNSKQGIVGASNSSRSMLPVDNNFVENVLRNQTGILMMEGRLQKAGK